MSNGEKLIADILTKYNYEFIQEKTLSDFRNNKYRFDFYLPNDHIAIEVQGAQHMVYTNYFYKTRSDFTKAQERDRLKISYCLANNIKLYCIPYWELENIKFPSDIFQEKFLAKSKFHNDIMYQKFLNK